jgi:alpha-tubulin suppressor-like RCC1 family protein
MKNKNLGLIGLCAGALFAVASIICGITNHNMPSKAVNAPEYSPLYTSVKFVDVSAGGGNDGHTLALDENGAIWSWGCNSDGQLGIGAAGDYILRPQKIDTKKIKNKKIAAGGYHSLAIGTDEKLYAWGDNAYGQCATGNTTDVLVPTKITTGNFSARRFDQIWAGGYSSYALILHSNDNRPYWVFGRNNLGQLGRSNTTDHLTPEMMPYDITVNPVMQFSVGYSHAAFLGIDGKIRIFGGNTHGALGVGTNITHNGTPTALNIAATFAKVACADDVTIALDNTGKLWSCGWYRYGTLGRGSAQSADLNALSLIPDQPDVFTNETFTDIISGGLTIYAKDNLNKWWWWGTKTFEENKYAEIDKNTYPVLFTDLPENLEIRRDSRDFHMATLDIGGNIWAWGKGGYGRVGNGTTETQFTPLQITQDVRKIVADLNTTITDLEQQLEELRNTSEPPPDNSAELLAQIADLNARLAAAHSALENIENPEPPKNDKTNIFVILTYVFGILSAAMTVAAATLFLVSRKKIEK